MEYLFFVFFAVYLSPWILSEWLERDDAGAILALNLLAGWTGVGWLGALAWAGSGALPARRAQPLLRLVPHPDEVRAAQRRRRWVAGSAGVALLTLGGALLLGRGEAEGLPTRSIVPGGAALLAAPDAARATVGTLPAGCRVAVLEARGEWRRVWRTSDCGAATGRASGWVRGPVSLAFR